MNRQSTITATRAIDVIVIGAGHAGMATSRVLQQRGIDHIVLERGDIANTWRFDRWDSLKLLTPNWMCQFPDFGYSGEDLNGFMSKSAFVKLLDDYAQTINLPVYTNTEVLKVRQVAEGYRVETSQGNWICRAVMLANGVFAKASVPRLADDVPTTIAQLTAADYRNVDQMSDGGVLVVGASATGLQLANEIQRSGRNVSLAVGEHVRLPRHYRGQDIHWWMNTLGLLDDRYDEVDDIDRARRVPSPQLVGEQGNSLDLNRLADEGVNIVGRLVGVNGGKLQFSGSLKNHCASADLKMNRLLAQVDLWISRPGHQSDYNVTAAAKPEITRIPDKPRLSMSCGEIKTILWATGFKPDYSWLDVSVFDQKGRLSHDGGAVTSPGLYALGHSFLRRRKSSYIYGVTDDTRDICAQLQAYLDVTAKRTLVA